MAVQANRLRDRTKLSEGSDADNEPLDPCECCTCEFARRMLNNITVFRANTQHIRHSTSSGNVSTAHSNTDSSATQEMLQRSQGKNDNRREKHNCNNAPADSPQKNFYTQNNNAPSENMKSKEPPNLKQNLDRQSQSTPPESGRTESLAERCQAIVNKLEAQIATDMDALFKCCQRNNIQLPAQQQSPNCCPVHPNSPTSDPSRQGSMSPQLRPPQQAEDPRMNPQPNHCYSCPHHAPCQNHVCYPCAVMNNVCGQFAPPVKEPDLDPNATSPEGAASSANGESRNDSLGDVACSANDEKSSQDNRGPQSLYSAPCDPQANFQCRCWYCHQNDRGPYECKILNQGVYKIIPNRPSSVPHECPKKKQAYDTYSHVSRNGPRWDPSSRWDVEHKRPMGIDLMTKKAESKGLLSELCAPCPPPPPFIPSALPPICPQHGLRGRTRSADTEDRRNLSCKKSRTRTEQSAGDCIEHPPMYLPSSCRGSSSQGGVSESLATSFTESKYHSAMDVTDSFDDEFSTSRLDKCTNFTNSKMNPEVKDSMDLKRTAIRRLGRERMRVRERNFTDNASDISYPPIRPNVEKPKQRVTFRKPHIEIIHTDKEHYASVANIRSLIDESDVSGCAKLFRASLHRLRNLSLLPCYHCKDTCNILQFHQTPGKSLRYPFLSADRARVKRCVSGRELRSSYQYPKNEQKKPLSPKRYERQSIVAETQNINTPATENRSRGMLRGLNRSREQIIHIKQSTSCEKSSFSDLEIIERSVRCNNALVGNKQKSYEKKSKSYENNTGMYNSFVKKHTPQDQYHAPAFKSTTGNIAKIDQLKRCCDNVSEASNQWHSTCEDMHPRELPCRENKHTPPTSDCKYRITDARNCQKCQEIGREYSISSPQGKGKSSKEKQQIMTKLNTATKTINELLSSVNILSSSSKKQSLVKSCMNLPEEVIKTAWDEIIKKTVEKLEGNGPEFEDNGALCGKLMRVPSTGHTSVLAYAPGKDDPSDNPYFPHSASRNYDNNFEKFAPSWDKTKRPCNTNDVQCVRHASQEKRDEMEKTGYLLDQITHRIAAIKEENGSSVPRRLRGGCGEDNNVQQRNDTAMRESKKIIEDAPQERHGKNDESYFNIGKYYPPPHHKTCSRAHSADTQRYIIREAEKGGAGDEHPAISRALGYPPENYKHQSLLKLNQRLRSADQCDSRMLTNPTMQASKLQHVDVEQHSVKHSRDVVKSQRKRKSAVAL